MRQLLLALAFLRGNGPRIRQQHEPMASHLLLSMLDGEGHILSDDSTVVFTHADLS